MPLTFASQGDFVSIKKINGNDETRKFLGSLGFTQGQNMTIVSKLGGNIILNIKNSRIAIDQSMACRIMI